MIKWLKQKKDWRPTRLDTPTDDKKATSFVAPEFTAGSTVLQRGDRLITLVWRKGDEDKQRSLPAGEYTVRTTRVEGEKDGKWWFLSSSGPGAAKVIVEDDNTTKFAANNVVLLSAKAMQKGKQIRLALGIGGADKRGISIYREGKRIPVTYRLLDKEGKTLAEGAMNYG